MTEIVPVPEGVHSTPFPTNADRASGAFNRITAAWGKSTRAQSVRDHEIAVATEINATAAHERAVIADDKAGEASASAATAAADALRLASLDALWLGALAADPATGRDGAPLVKGNAYVSTATGYIRAYNGAAWVQGVGAVAGVTSLNGQIGDLALKTIGGQSPYGAGDISFSTFEIGDARSTVGAPNADWVEADKIYLQSSYAALFGVLGLRPNTVTATTDAGLAIGTRTGVAASSLGAVVVVGGSAPLIRRRSTAGVWSSPSHSAPGDTRFGGVGSGNGVFVAVAGDHGWGNSTLALRSEDDGVTWAARVLPSGGWYFVKCEEQSGYWMAIGSSQCAVSRDAGLTWVAATLPSGVSNIGSLTLSPCGGGKFLLSDRSSLLANVWVATVTSSTVTWAAMALPSSIYWLGADLRNGVLLVAGHLNGKLWLCRSTNFGTSFSIEQQDIANFLWFGIQFTDDIAVIFDNSGRTLTSLSGGPFQLKEIPSLAGGVSRAASLGKDCVLVGLGSASTSMARISGKDYDPATQFYVPQPNVTIAPFKNWVKAK